MNTSFLRYAIEVEHTCSISKAAENLYMAQPNLSKAIKELEESLGFAIFRRTSRGVTPTENGREFLLRAHVIVNEIEQMHLISSLSENRDKTFQISIPRGSYLSSSFLRFLSELDTLQNRHISVQETNSMQTIENVSSGQFRLGIIRYQTDYEQYFQDYLKRQHLDAEPIWTFSYVLLVSHTSPLASSAEITPEDLTAYTEIVHGDTSIPYLSNSSRRADPEAYDAHDRGKIFIYDRCNQFELLTRIPSTYMWVSPMPQDFLSRYDLVQLPLAFSQTRYKDVLISSSQYQLTGLEQHFIDKVREVRKEISEHEPY